MRPMQEELAIQRTQLAEERTHLAYIRTGLNLVLAGLFFVGYFPPASTYTYIGLAGTAIGILFLVYGFYHHQKSRAFLDEILRNSVIFKKKQA